MHKLVVQFDSTDLEHCQNLLRKQLFAEAYKKYKGNLYAIRQALNTSRRQVYNIRALFTETELALLLKPKTVNNVKDAELLNWAIPKIK
jgi:hypothetical protein